MKKLLLLLCVLFGVTKVNADNVAMDISYATGAYNNADETINRPWNNTWISTQTDPQVTMVSYTEGTTELRGLIKLNLSGPTVPATIAEDLSLQQFCFWSEGDPAEFFITLSDDDLIVNSLNFDFVDGPVKITTDGTYGVLDVLGIGTASVRIKISDTTPMMNKITLVYGDCGNNAKQAIYTVGDINADGNVTISDVTSLVNILLGAQNEYYQPRADVNIDGEISIADVTELINVILGKSVAKTVDYSYRYANITALVYAGQTASENAAGSGYMLQKAVSIVNNSDVSSYYTNLSDFVTTLRVSTSLSNVESVSIFAKNKAQIAGKMVASRKNTTATYSYTSGTALTYATNQVSNVVTVTGSNAGTYVAYLRPMALPSGVLVTVRTADGKFYSQTFTDIRVGEINDLTFTETSPSNLWMSTIPGNTYFSMLSTPGAHDAATSNCGSLAKCQNEDIAGLLANGVRAFDLRPRYNSSTESDITLNNLEIYHGIISTGVKFKDAIDILINFVKNNPSEAVSVLMKKENANAWIINPNDYSATWRASMRECFGDASRKPYIMTTVSSNHTLDNVRGKVSIVSRTPYGNESGGYRDVVYGAIIEDWPENSVVSDYSCDMTLAGNSVQCHASVQDAYECDIFDKQAKVRAQVKLASANTNRARYNFNYTSLSNNIVSNAESLNPAAVDFINEVSGPLCYVYGDFMGSSSYGGANLLKAIVNQNYKYVYKGRTRWE